MDIKNNIVLFQTEAAKKGARLIAVTKNHTTEELMVAYQAGQRLMGENKVQEMVAKYEALPKDVEWHMIGHLQSNKVRHIASFVSLIHSVDSLRLLEEIDKQARKNNRIIPCLLQVHIAAEETKFGFDADELRQLIAGNGLAPMSHIRIRGLMGMASLTQVQEQISAEFHTLRMLFDEIRKMTCSPNVEMKELSMGMSSDYHLALTEGSTLIRIGSAIFGSRY